MPKGASLSPDGRTLYVTNYGQLGRQSVTLHDTRTLRRTGHIDLPGIAVESAVSPDGRTLYVSNFRRHSVQFVDLATRTVSREVPAGRHPKILVLSHDGRRLFAANWADRSVTEIDTRRAAVVRTLAVGENPRGMAITRSGRLYVANFSDHTLDVFEGRDLTQHQRVRHVCRVPRHLALSPDDRQLYISCLTASEVAVLDTATQRVVRRVPVGRSPKALDVMGNGRYVVTADYGGSSATVIDTLDWRAQRVPVPGMDHASGVVAARNGLRFFVTGWYDDHVYSLGLDHAGPRYTIPAALERVVRTRRAWHDAHPAE
jgi:YVTN family beta-propeller protein